MTVRILWSTANRVTGLVGVGLNAGVGEAVCLQHNIYKSQFQRLHNRNRKYENNIQKY